MSWVAVAIGGSALVGAYSSNQSAKAANKTKNSWTDQQTTQDPYMAQRLNPGINAVLDRQAKVFDLVPQIDARGNVRYVDPMTGRSDVPTPYTDNRDQPKPVPTNNVGGGAGGGQRLYSGTVPAGNPTAGMTAKQAKQYKAEQDRIAQGTAGKKGKGANPGIKPPAGGGGQTTPQGMFQDIYAKGMGDQSALVGAGDRALQSILGGSATGRDEETGFEGYNPILDFQARQLMGEDAGGSDLLRDFLGIGEGGSYNPNGRGGMSGGSGQQVRAYSATAGPGGQVAQPQGGGVPDTMTGNGWFQQHANELWGTEADPELQALIDANAADMEKAYWRSRADADSAAAGAGRLGGGSWNAQTNQARQDLFRDVGTYGSQLRMQDRGKRQDIRQNVLGQVSQRDLAAMNDATQRAGIAASESAASAGAGAASESARRGQDLQAILGLMSYDTDQRRLLSGIGSELSGNRISALGLIPGQQDARYAGIDRALGAAGAYGSYDASIRNANTAANAQRSIANQQMGMQAGMFNASQNQASIDNYLRTLGMVGGMGGSSHTWGQNAVPGAGVSVGGATAAGALGGALAGWGAYNQYKG